MKLAFGLVFAGLALATMAHAEGLPPGPYLDTCSGAKAAGPNLMAACRDSGGVAHNSALINFPRCVGPIVNHDGVLTCDFGLHPASLATPRGRW